MRKCAWLHNDETKNQRSLSIPLNDDAIAILRQQQGKHGVYMFTYKGGRLKNANTKAWRKALDRAGIYQYSDGEKYPTQEDYLFDDFRWHDLRHSWASMHTQNGTPLHVLQEMGGWSSPLMVQRYAHLANEHLQPYAGNSVITGTILVQEKQSPETQTEKAIH